MWQYDNSSMLVEYVYNMDLESKVSRFKPYTSPADKA